MSGRKLPEYLLNPDFSGLRRACDREMERELKEAAEATEVAKEERMWREFYEASNARHAARWRDRFERIESGSIPGDDARGRPLLRSLSIYPGVRAAVERVVTTPGEYMSYAGGYSSETYMYHSPTKGILMVVRHVGDIRYDESRGEWHPAADHEEWYTLPKESVCSILVQAADGDHDHMTVLSDEMVRAIVAHAEEMVAAAVAAGSIR